MPGTRASQLHRTQRLSRLRPAACLAALLLAATPLRAATVSPQSDALARARLLYNQQQYEQAIAAAEQALRAPALADTARLVIGRSCLERFRQTANAADLEAGRDALRRVRASALSSRDRVDLVVGLGEALYLANDFGAASEIFSSALGPGTPADLRDSALDWWASALDRLALGDAVDDSAEIYTVVATRMEEELERDPASATAAYWLAAASRGAGDLERAWSAAVAGWVRAQLAPARAATLRADLDHLVQTALIPDRARQLGGDREQTMTELKKEWEDVKANWK